MDIPQDSGRLGGVGLQGLLRHAEEQQRRLAEFQRERAELRIEGESPDGMVRVTIDGDMKVSAIDINARAMRMDSFSLAEAIQAAIDAGYAAFQERSQELLGDMLGNSDAIRQAQAGEMTPERWFENFGVNISDMIRRVRE